LTFSQYSEQSAACNNAMVGAIAACMMGVGVAESDIFLLVIDADSRRNAAGKFDAAVASVGAAAPAPAKLTDVRSLRGLMGYAVSHVTSLASSSNYVIMEYTVYVNTKYSYDQITSQLTNNVNSGYFTQMLQSQAVLYGATTLLYATSYGILYTVPRDDDMGQNDDHKLSDGVVAGIVIGSVVGTGLLVGFIMYVRGAAASSSSGLANQGSQPEL
jgi:hypothetical protein